MSSHRALLPVVKLIIHSAQKYTVTISRNPHDLLLQWLSGAAQDEEWEMGRHSVAGRAKVAVNGIVVNRLRIEGVLNWTLEGVLG